MNKQNITKWYAEKHIRLHETMEGMSVIVQDLDSLIAHLTGEGIEEEESMDPVCEKERLVSFITVLDHGPDMIQEQIAFARERIARLTGLLFGT